MAKSEVSVDQVIDLLSYDPDTGLFVWKYRPRSMFASEGKFVTWNSRYANKTAGTLVKGYVSIKLFDSAYSAHRLAWLYVNGAWPESDIDHINGCRSDNRLLNLRSVSRQINCQNLRNGGRRKRSGLPLGVSISLGSRVAPYRAHIELNGVTTCLGRFATPEEAHLAYVDAKRRLHDGCTI